MEVDLTFKVYHTRSGRDIGATCPGTPNTPLLAVDENGLLVVLRPDGTYEYPAAEPWRVVWSEVQK